jgi:bifunctional non-homologous end joining protein LigD
MTGEPVTVAVDGREVRLSSLDRVLWPATGHTKADLLAYYTAVAPAMLPHLADRPVTLHRFPEGVGGPHFYQTRTPPRPEWVRAAVLHFERTGKTFETPIVDDLPSLVWATNLTTIELHPFLSAAGDFGRPTALVFDLDPGPPADLLDAARAALDVRAVLDGAGLRSWPKTSGSKGIHVYVPLNTPVTYAGTKAYARAVARKLAAEQPDRFVDRMTRALRPGKVLVDWSQNDPGKSTVVAYSVRALRAPSVSVPVTWDEIDSAVTAGDPRPLVHGMAAALDRVNRLGDIFAPVLTTKQRLPATTA